MRVLFVGPSHPEAAWLFKALQESAHSLQRADDLRDGVFLASQEPFDAIVLMVLDVGTYSSLQGFIAEFAAAGSGAAIVAVLGAATAQDRTRILRAGADACFCQPYSFIEMHERMAALQRVGGGGARGALGGSASASVSASSILSAVGGPALDAATRELVCGGRRVAVTRREFLLLECLLRQVNAPVARDQLIRYAWPEKEDVDPSSVNLVVSRLRRKLLGDAPEVRIETVSRFGYQVSVS
ncbi:Transcriptional regulatory protein CusR [Paraburkholderia domus]|jgi:Response regulators consisting of a CheY-like receiver domain and a winged-helix DNA-binding domain|uniref:Transcriptional regulatory protein CusR n=1 Tax=Paraburkholderia domus TaxID=2793075 RepID=A0A9N8MVB5_9BURK|nr:response regulator transcription factor [Paraburkholderia domus]MBK5050055.1 response regulator transcription factor [Burkholderia sp. R-70006]MBK5064251.1 response regulator transcription factor [Burkholderia sp. R-70199]MBK5086790.1 response regulator transcription factor [Burkholderia sp. R-69927]MBK5121513.1 response regulator transcription factor [Burkholderia sp. R-69980]MBK5166656.1 response regulator transcription factor [Burkholderia sp. R-70211]MBK5185338.1 response regulator tra